MEPQNTNEWDELNYNEAFAFPLTILTHELYDRADQMDKEAGYSGRDNKGPGRYLRAKATRLGNIFVDNDLHYMYQLTQMSKKRFKKLKGVGRKMFKIVEEFVWRHNLCFDMNFSQLNWKVIERKALMTPVEARDFFRSVA